MGTTRSANGSSTIRDCAPRERRFSVTDRATQTVCAKAISQIPREISRVFHAASEDEKTQWTLNVVVVGSVGRLFAAVSAANRASSVLWVDRRRAVGRAG